MSVDPMADDDNPSQSIYREFLKVFFLNLLSIFVKMCLLAAVLLLALGVLYGIVLLSDIIIQSATSEPSDDLRGAVSILLAFLLMGVIAIAIGSWEEVNQ